MPRSNRRRVDHAPLALGRLAGMERREQHWDGAWTVRRVRGAGQGRVYRCPGCNQELSDDLPHVVAWPAEGMRGLPDRRHWHTSCWAAKDRRRV
ncbi:hypothetical protein MM440_15715 [Arsenicicoccus piscis]|uniref:ATP/GTP-binding protein n=1 Tax=Arsenicicoccus piscis TaxID=673954 RepID=A0ABQ6HQH1_9MICO|nr:hypothetical protein [Arsenicicoccus piscis]MCH8629180.1 hypothetical protein [Arsenicicoccus piscis]GMA20252.1 hypothetical protein GCM10025862_22730 [Arsenicicoccus piscis]